MTFSTVVPFSYAEVSEEDGKLFAESVQLLKEKKFQSSLIKTRQFLANNPENLEAKTNECAALLELKKLPEAETCLQSNLTERPDDLSNLTNLGILYTLHENYDAAKTQFSLVHQMYPDDVTAYANLLATRVILNENVEQIIQEQSDLLTRDEFNVQVLVNIGKILNDKKELEKSKYFLDRAYEIDKNHVNVLEQLGVWYALNGDLQNAEKFFLLALGESPNNISVLNNLGLLHKERGDKFNVVSEYYKSIEYYESVLHIDPDNVIANSGRDDSAQKIQDLYQRFYFIIYLIAILAILSGILLTWVYTRDTKKLEKSLEITTDNKQIEKILKKLLTTKVSRIFLIGLLSIASVIIILNLTLKIPLNDDWDMANWTSTVVEIGIGIIIAAVILVYELSKQERFNDEQKEIEKLVKQTSILVANIQKFETEQQQFLKEQKEIQHQNYKERLFDELSRLLFLIDTNASLYLRSNKTDGVHLWMLNPIDENAFNKNTIKAEKILARLNVINSIFMVPSNIKSKFDEILSHYDDIISSTHTGVIKTFNYQNLNVEFATQLQTFLKNEFFTEKNSEMLADLLKRIDNDLTRITLSGNKK